MNIVSLPIEHDKKKIDSRFRLVVMASQRAKELAFGAKAKVKTKFKKASTVSIEEALESKLEFFVGEEAKLANEKVKNFDYKQFLEEKRKETLPEDLSELEKDLRVYLHEKGETEKQTLEELFGEKQEKSEGQSEG